MHWLASDRANKSGVTKEEARKELREAAEAVMGCTLDMAKGRNVAKLMASATIYEGIAPPLGISRAMFEHAPE